MDIISAAEKTIEHIGAGGDAMWPHDVESLTFTHVHAMLVRISQGDIVGEKAHRWLGWAQCAAVAAGAGTLDDMKRINHEASLRTDCL